jgi:hypothetical protein
MADPRIQGSGVPIHGETWPDFNRKIEATTLAQAQEAVIAGSHMDGQFNDVLDFKNARQNVVNPSLTGDGQYNDTSWVQQGDNVLLGQDTAAESALTDGDYPHPLNPLLPGDTISGDSPQRGATKGGQVDFASVGPYKYPEFPKDTGRSGAGPSPIPLM